LFWLSVVQIFPVYNELAANTQPRMNIVIGTSIGLANITYEIIAVFGYLTFGSKVSTGQSLGSNAPQYLYVIA
jgi:amino acid permease